MAGLVPAIHVFYLAGVKTWMPGTRPGMTGTAWSRSPLDLGKIRHRASRGADFVEQF
jgi:hypothetical protein